MNGILADLLTAIQEPFMQRALLAALAVAAMAGPLGSAVLWRRMAWFGDATAHAALLGVALAFLTDQPAPLGILLAALLAALFLHAFSAREHGNDALLGVISHGGLGLGLLALALAGGGRGRIEGFLFGDILAIGWSDAALALALAAAVLLTLALRWRGLLLATLSEDLAVAYGVRPGRERAILLLMLALVVAVAIKITGALLVSALLIIPAASARAWARTPEGMAALAALFGMGAALLGLAGAWLLDAPAGPAIVTAALVLFFLAQLARRAGG